MIQRIINQLIWQVMCMSIRIEIFVMDHGKRIFDGKTIYEMAFYLGHYYLEKHDPTLQDRVDKYCEKGD